MGVFATHSVHALKITVELAVARIIRLGALQAIAIWCACGISKRSQSENSWLERRGTLGDPWRDSLGVVQTPKVDLPTSFLDGFINFPSLKAVPDSARVTGAFRDLFIH